MKFFIIISTAVRSVFANLNVLLKALFFPIILYPLLYVGQLPGEDWWGYTFQEILNCALMALIAIPVHRAILLGPDSVTNWGVIMWSKKETMFTSYLFAISFIFDSIVLLMQTPLFEAISNDLILMGIKLIIIILFISVSIRLILVFPAIAVDGNASLKNSWEITKGHQIVLCFVIAVFPIISMIPIVSIPEEFAEPSVYIFLRDIFNIIIEIIAIASLSIAYRMFSEEKNLSLPVD